MKPQCVRLIFGGTFDPIHLAHLRVATDCAKLIQADWLHFIPCYQPVHKGQPRATLQQRLDMLQLAIADIPNALVDSREVERQGPSFMIETLKTLRADYPKDVLCLLIGGDSWRQFDTWHRWQEFCDWTHLLIADRPSYDWDISEQQQAWSLDKQIVLPEQLKQKACGKILRQRVSYLPISATQVRKVAQQGADLQPFLPEKVARYIKQNAIYRDRGEL